MHAYALCGSQLCLHSVIIEHHFIVARLAMLGLMREARAVASLWILCRTRIGVYLSRGGHDEDIAQIGVAGTAQMCVTEAHDGLVPMLIAGTVLIYPFLVLAIHIVWNGVGLWTQLHKAKG